MPGGCKVCKEKKVIHCRFAEERNNFTIDTEENLNPADPACPVKFFNGVNLVKT